MELRIRHVLGPFARMAALVLKKTKASALAVSSASISISLLVALSFYFMARDPYNEGLPMVAIALVLLSALADEAVREFAKLKKPTDLERIGFELAGYADVAIAMAAVYYLRTVGYDLDLGNRLRGWENLAIGGIFFFGVYLLGRAEKAENPGFEARSERMLFLTAFMTAGIVYENFSAFLLTGLAILGGVLYSIAVWRSAGRFREKHSFRYNLSAITGPIKNFSFFVLNGLASLVRAIPRATGKISKSKKVAPEQVEVEIPSGHARAPGRSFTAVVTDGKSSTPIAHAKVAFEDKDTGRKTVRYTDSAGRSEFDGIGEGHYAISIQAEGFKAEEYERFITMDSGEVFALSRHSSDLSVVVTDGDRRNPIGGAKVKLKNGGQESAATTDNLGVAYFGELEVAAYDLSVEVEGYSAFEGKVDLAVENLKSVELRRTFTSPELKRPVVLEEEEPEVELEEEVEEVSEVETSVEEEEAAGPEPEERIIQVLGESALVGCAPNSKIEKAAIKIMQECVANGREVYLISSERRAHALKTKLAREAKDGKVKIIELMPPGKSGDVEGIPMDDLRRLREMFEEMPAGGVMIFEALSSLILGVGGVAAYKFISDALRYFSAEGLCLVCFIEKGAHGESEMASFEKLFVNLVDLQKDKFVLRA